MTTQTQNKTSYLLDNKHAMEAIELTTQTQTKDYIGCSNVNAVLLRYLEMLKDKGLIEEHDYYYYEDDYYTNDIQKNFSDINAVLWEYLEMLDNEGIIEDYADNHGINQFFDNWSFEYSKVYIYAEDIIEALDKVYYENKPDEDEYDDYDYYDYVRALEKFENEELDDEELEERHNKLCNVIYDLKDEFYSNIEFLRDDLQFSTPTLSFKDKETGAIFYIPTTSEFFEYYYNSFYEYLEFEMKHAIYEASREYPFIRDL